jgi:hypothetical protein
MTDEQDPEVKKALRRQLQEAEAAQEEARRKASVIRAVLGRKGEQG